MNHYSLLAISFTVASISFCTAQQSMDVGFGYREFDPTRPVLRILKNTATVRENSTGGSSFREEVLLGNSQSTEASVTTFRSDASGRYLIAKAKANLNVDHRNTTTKARLSLTIRKIRDFGVWQIDDKNPEYTQDALNAAKHAANPEDLRTALGEYVVIGGRKVATAECELTITSNRTHEAFSMDAYGMVKAEFSIAEIDSSRSISILREKLGNDMTLAGKFRATGVRDVPDSGLSALFGKDLSPEAIASTIDKQLVEILKSGDSSDAFLTEYKTMPISVFFPATRETRTPTDVVLNEVSSRLETIRQEIARRQFVNDSTSYRDFVVLFGQDQASIVRQQLTDLIAARDRLIEFVENPTEKNATSATVPNIPPLQPVPSVEIVITNSARFDEGAKQSELMIGYVNNKNANTVSVVYSDKSPGRDHKGEVLNTKLMDRQAMLTALRANLDRDSLPPDRGAYRKIELDAIAQLEQSDSVLLREDKEEARYFILRGDATDRDFLYIITSGPLSSTIFGSQAVNRVGE